MSSKRVNLYDKDSYGRTEGASPGLVERFGGSEAAWEAARAELTGMTDEELAANEAAEVVAKAARMERRKSELLARTYPAGHVVYYMRFCCRIKIGMTTNLAKRAASVPCDEVLATEPGGGELEFIRHWEFASARLLGEWFEPSEALVSHVLRLRNGQSWQGCAAR